MAQIPSLKALTEGDGLNDYFNVNTTNQRLELPNGSALVQYADNYVTPGLQLTGGNIAPAVSATAVVIANAGTIATAGIGISRLAPAVARNSIVLQPGTIPGQQVWVINESAYASFITFATAGSNVFGGNANVITGGGATLFVWDANTSLWYNMSLLSLPQSATAVAIANAGTIAVTGLLISRLNPGAAVTGIILAPGTYAGQTVWVVNEAAAANTITFNTTPATANVADSATEPALAGLAARLFVWDSITALWYRAS